MKPLFQMSYTQEKIKMLAQMLESHEKHLPLIKKTQVDTQGIELGQLWK